MNYFEAVLVSSAISLLITIPAVYLLYPVFFGRRNSVKTRPACRATRREAIQILEPSEERVIPLVAGDPRQEAPQTLTQMTATRCRRVHVTNPRYKPVSGRTVLYFYS